jgi:hypothetical protein
VKIRGDLLYNHFTDPEKESDAIYLKLHFGEHGSGTVKTIQDEIKELSDVIITWQELTKRTITPTAMPEKSLNCFNRHKTTTKKISGQPVDNLPGRG